MRKLVLLSICLLVLVPLAQSAESVYKYRQTIEITETSGLQRMSFPVNVNLPVKNIGTDMKDIWITDEKGKPVSFAVTGKSSAVVNVRFPADLDSNQKKTYYAFMGSGNPKNQTDSFSGVQQFIGMKFVAFAWGTVKISSYSKNNIISITDNSNRMIRDEDNVMVATETYQAGTVRSFKLAIPTPLRISCTGLASVAIGNFDAGETDSDCLISNNILVYVPKFLAITSFHTSNKVQVWNRSELAEEKLLGIGETLVFDGIPSGFRRIVADRECLIQYGTASAFSLFAVPSRGDVYRFIPLGPVHISGQDQTEVWVVYPDGRPTDKYTLSANQVINLDTHSYLKNIGTDKVVKALEIKSTKPMTVLGAGGAGGHGATYLYGDDGFAVTKQWNTISGDVDKANPTNRNTRLIAPFSKSEINKDYGNGSIFPNLAPGGLAISLKEFSVEFSSISIQTNQDCLMLDGNPDDLATFFQVPALIDTSVKVSVPKTETKDGGWIPGKIDNPPVKTEPEQKTEDSGFVNFFKNIWSFVNPKDNPLVFALTLIGLALLCIIIASIFVRKRKNVDKVCDDGDEEKLVKDNPDELLGEPHRPEFDPAIHGETPEEPDEPSREDWFERILDEEPNVNNDGISFKAPKLRAPKIAQIMGNAPKEQTEKPKPQPQPHQKPLEPPKPEPEQSKVEQIPETQKIYSQQEVEQETIKEQPETSTIDKINLSVSKITPVIRNLAHQLSAEGMVADPGAIMRLYREGLLELFSHICISQTATSVLPAQITGMAIFEKVHLTPREMERSQKLAKDLGLFDEVAKAVVIAEKNGLPNYLTSARLPEKLGRLKITSIESFC